MKKMKAIKRAFWAEAILLIFVLSGCIPRGFTEEEEEEQIDRAVALAEETIGKISSSATVSSGSFQVQTIPNPETHGLRMTDWVEGRYKDGGVETVWVNVETEEVFLSKEWTGVLLYSRELAYNLYGLDESDMKVEVHGSLELPYCEGHEDYGYLILTDMLPAGAGVNDKYIEKVLFDGEYQITYYFYVSDEVDMSIFENTDYRGLGEGVHLIAEQYTKEEIDLMYTPGENNDISNKTPIMVYDSEIGYSGGTSGTTSTPGTTSVPETEDMQSLAIPELYIGEDFYTLDLDGNEAADVFFENLKADMLMLKMRDNGGFEKIAELPFELTEEMEEFDAEPGDILLYEGNRLGICYAATAVKAVRIGRINCEDAEELEEALGDGSVTIQFTVEWTE